MQIQCWSASVGNLKVIFHWWKIIISEYILFVHQMIKMIFLMNKDHLLPHIHSVFIEFSVLFTLLSTNKCAWILQPNDSIFIVISMIVSMTEYVYIHIFRNIFGVIFHIIISVTDTRVQAESMKNKPTCPLCVLRALGLLTFRLDCLLWSTGPPIP